MRVPFQGVCTCTHTYTRTRTHTHVHTHTYTHKPSRMLPGSRNEGNIGGMQLSPLATKVPVPPAKSISLSCSELVRADSFRNNERLVRMQRNGYKVLLNNGDTLSIHLFNYFHCFIFNIIIYVCEGVCVCACVCGGERGTENSTDLIQKCLKRKVPEI